MKTILNLCLITAFTFVFANTTMAQKSVKEMDKKTKSELKEYIKNPSSYRKMISNYKDQIEGYELQVAELQEDFYKADYLRVMYYDSIQELHAQMNTHTNTTTNNYASAANDDPNYVGANTGATMYKNTGTDYRVQIGAYRYFDFTKLLKFNQPIGFENVNGVIHYFLGSWTDANEAFKFAQALRKIEIKGAFVSKYVDGKRIPYDHLVEGGGTAFNY